MTRILYYAALALACYAVFVAGPRAVRDLNGHAYIGRNLPLTRTVRETVHPWVW